MAIRTTPALVKGILLNDYDTRREPALSPFIDTANMMVNRLSTLASNNGTPLTTTELELIERWLSAHFYKVSDRGYAEKQTDQARGRYHGQTAKNLEFTPYGQMALVIDHTGLLGTISEGVVGSIGWLGKTESESLDWDQRN